MPLKLSNSREASPLKMSISKYILSKLSSPIKLILKSSSSPLSKYWLKEDSSYILIVSLFVKIAVSNTQNESSPINSSLLYPSPQ